MGIDDLLSLDAQPSAGCPRKAAVRIVASGALPAATVAAFRDRYLPG